MREDRQIIAIAFGRSLRAVREDKGWSQEELALTAGVDRTFVSRAERGERQPALATVFLLAQALEVDAAELVGRTEAGLESLGGKGGAARPFSTSRS